MQRRIANVNISSAGGTASKGSKTYKVTLPTSWVGALGIDGERREVELAFDGEYITLSRLLTAGEFAGRKLEQGHDVRKFWFYDGDSLCTTIYADFTDETLAVENHVDDPVKTAFGCNSRPKWDDFMAFLEDRCIPRERAGLLEYLEAIGIGGYESLDIIGKTAGRMAEDNQWLKIGN
jgi:hypothetical protein